MCVCHIQGVENPLRESFHSMGELRLSRDDDEPSGGRSKSADFEAEGFLTPRPRPGTPELAEVKELLPKITSPGPPGIGPTEEPSAMALAGGGGASNADLIL